LSVSSACQVPHILRLLSRGELAGEVLQIEGVSSFMKRQNSSSGSDFSQFIKKAMVLKSEHAVSDMTNTSLGPQFTVARKIALFEIFTSYMALP
jgi:hypothetical protein